MPTRPTSAFTLIEILLAVTLMAVVMTVAYLGFSTVTLAWQRGTQLADKLHHGDFVVEQLVMALRSTYYPATAIDADYGFRLENNGDGPGAIDKASWVKLGSALVGKDAVYAGGPHRIEVGGGETEHGDPALAVRAWGLLSQIEDFKPEALPVQLLSAKVTGINYRFQDPESDKEADEVEWIDEWTETNRIPELVELTVYMEPTDKDEKAIEIKRIVRIPLGPLAWATGIATQPPAAVPPVAAAPNVKGVNPPRTENPNPVQIPETPAAQ